MKCSTASISRWSKRVAPLTWTRTSPSVVVDRLVDVVKATLLAKPETSCSRMVAVVKEALDIQVSRQLIHNVISRRLQFTYKRSRKRGVPRSDPAAHSAVKKRFANDFVSAHDSNHLIVSIDESGFNTDSVPRYGYAPRGKRHVVKFVRSSDRKNHTLLLAIDNHGGKKYEIESARPVDASRFKKFVESLQYPSGTRIVMDNASIHWTRDVKRVLDERGYVALRMPAYTPEGNPVEMVFGWMKTAWYRLDDRGDNVAAVQNAIRGIVDTSCPSASLKSCFDHVAREMSSW